MFGGVGSLSVHLARWVGATVIGTVRRSGDMDHVDPAVISHRIVEMSLSANADLNITVTVPDAVIAPYGTHADRTELPSCPLLFNNVTLRLLGSDDFPATPNGRPPTTSPRPPRADAPTDTGLRHRLTSTPSVAALAGGPPGGVSVGGRPRRARHHVWSASGTCGPG